jgi:hypothetical protein
MGFHGKELTSTYFQKTRSLEIVSSDKEIDWKLIGVGPS